MLHDYPIINDDPATTDTANPLGVSKGYVERDYKLYPAEMFDAPTDMELIPRSEWDARIDEQEAAKSSLEHLYLRNGTPAFPNLDQDGNGYCVTADTEVLTERGWVAYPEYNWRDPLATVNPVTHNLEFQAPFQKHIYEYDGPIVCSTNRRIDFAVTPDHQMYVRKWDERKRTLSSQYSFVRAADIGWYAGLLHAPSGWLGTDLVEVEIPGDRRYDGDDFIAMLGLIVSDGYAGGAGGSRQGKGTRNWVSFASFREESRAAIEALAARIGFHESPSRRGVWMRYDAGHLAEWIRQNCYTSPSLRAQAKRTPEIIKCASVRQIKEFLHWFDDRSRNGTWFYSASKRLADDIQELLLRIGKRGSVTSVPPKTSYLNGVAINGRGGFQVYVSDTERLCLDRKKHIETDHYKGLVYCAAVPNHTLLTRRNGSVLVSSNCWTYSTGHALMLQRLRDNQPLVRLNPHATAAIIKGGRDEGGWSGLSAKFAREVGYAEEGTGSGQWPLHSRNLKYDTPELRANMAKHKVVEDYVDLTRSVYDQNLTFDQLATQLLLNNPCPVDFNWWSHAICAVRLVRVERGSYGILILNSWSGWGRFGLGVLQGSKSIPDGALCVRTSTISPS